jgi:hypothetical protein
MDQGDLRQVDTFRHGKYPDVTVTLWRTDTGMGFTVRGENKAHCEAVSALMESASKKARLTPVRRSERCVG